MQEPIDWQKHGFVDITKHHNPSIYMNDDWQLFELSEENGFLKISVNMEYVVSEGIIPATNESIESLLKAFKIGTYRNS